MCGYCIQKSKYHFLLISRAGRSPDTFRRVLSRIVNRRSTRLLLISVMASKNSLNDRSQSSVERFPFILSRKWT